MADLVLLRFVAHHHSYNANDEAGFDRARADKMIAAGVAVELGADGKPVKVKTKPAAEAETKPAPAAESKSA